jgi:hypothetical protein
VKRLLLVVGVGRSGTSLFTGIVGQLGFHVPQPEVVADDTNPRGFSEPRWVVDFHTRLLKKRRVTVNDSRPAAWESTATAADDEAVRAELREWLSGQLAEASSVVVKDPRTGWFLPLWTAVADELGVETSFVTMLRHPAEVLASATKSYGTWQTPGSRVAAWVNVTLETERATRERRRAFIRYDDLLRHWQGDINRVGRALQLPELASASAERNPEADRFVDPGLHRNRVRWDEVGAPARVQDLAERVWAEVQPLADPDGDTPAVRAALDDARAAFGEMYAEAESIAQSSIHAARPPKKPKAETRQAPPPSLRARLTRRVPAPYRRRVRAALGSLRRS